MSTEQAPSGPMEEAAIKTSAHPLCPLTASEIRHSASLIRDLYPAKTEFNFKAITLQEPEKAHIVPFLDAEHSGARLPEIDRKAFVCYYLRNTVSTSAGTTSGPVTTDSWYALSRTNSTKQLLVFLGKKSRAMSD